MAGFSVNQEKQQCSDQELVVKTLDNKQKFAAIVRRYEAPLFRYIVRQGCKDTAMAQDLLQEVFIKAYIHLNDYDPTLSFSSWIYRIAHNETVSHFRKEKNRPCVLDKGENDYHFEKIADDLGLAEPENQKHLTLEIQSAVDGLESKYRDVIVLKFFEEKSYEEISDILQMPEGTVATLINRAKKKIKACLEKK
ncbi:MAG: RNA polymerase sigma factor [Chlorobiaceae bacterium]|nr:RNA polymerase sigma factor [Chlorobiaceae bacterium]